MADSEDQTTPTGESTPTGEQSTRVRKYTEKGLEWQISQTKHNLKASISSWRTNAAKMPVLLSDCSDIGSIRSERYHLEGLISDVRISSLFDVDSEAHEIAQQVNILEGENLRIMSDISEHNRELDRDSIASKSRSSAHSSRSRLSR